MRNARTMRKTRTARNTRKYIRSHSVRPVPLNLTFVTLTPQQKKMDTFSTVSLPTAEMEALLSYLVSQTDLPAILNQVITRIQHQTSQREEPVPGTIQPD